MDRCPYKGLLPYTEDDAAYFFGRDTERRIIGENLRASRLTLLYGESGAGKSSVLRAGVAYDVGHDPDYGIVVFPRIQKGEAVDSWRNDPVAGIARAIHESLGGTLARSLKPQFAPPPPEVKPVIIGNTMILPPSPPRTFSYLLEPQKPTGGGDTAGEKSPDLGGLLEEYADATGRNLLIVFDQFEEYFQYHPNESGPGTLAGELPQLVNRRDLPANFLISIRQDAVASLDRFKNHIPSLFSNFLRIEYLSPQSAQAAILQPLGKYNEEAEIGRRALAAIEGYLPTGKVKSPHRSLQMVLAALGDQVHTEALKQARALFGDGVMVMDIPHIPLIMTNAVAADVVQEIIRAQGDDRQQVQAAYLQLVMTRWWEKEVDARSGEMRRQTLDELGGVKKIVDEHLEKTIRELGAARQDEVARIFGPMVTSAGRKIAQTVTELVGSTHLTGETLGTILEALLKARIMATVPPPRGSQPDEKCYEFAHDVVAKAALEWLGRRRQAQKAEAAEREASLAKQRAEDERKRADEQTRQIIKLRRLAWALAGVLLLALAAVFVAVWQRTLARTSARSAQAARDRAEKIERTAKVRELISSSTLSLGEDPERSVLLAMHAVALTWSSTHTVLPEAEEQLHRAIAASHARRTLLTLSRQSAVNSVAWSPDGKRLATGSDGTVIWEAATGKVLLNVSGDGGVVSGLAWSPDGKRLATDGSAAKVWDAAIGKELLNLSGSGVAISGVAWNPDGKRLATGNLDGAVTVWNAVTCKILRSWPGHPHSVESAAWSPDGNRLATVSGDKTGTVWDAATGKELLSFSGHSHPAFSVAWSPDGEQLATACEDGTASVWKAATGEELRSLSGHQGQVWTVAWSPDGRRLATGSMDHTTKVWDPTSGKELLSLVGHTGDVVSVAWSPDGTRLATGSWDKTAKIWDASPGIELLSLSGHNGGASDVAWSPDGKRLATASDDETAEVWDAIAGKELLTLGGGSYTLSRVAWSPDGKRLATAGKDQAEKVWDASTGKELFGLSDDDASASCVAWSPDGKRLATGAFNRTVTVWDADTGKELLNLSGHYGPVTSVAWSPDGRRLATGSEDLTAKIWDAGTTKELLSLFGHSRSVYSVAWSPDGKRLATGSGDTTAKVWDATSGKELLSFSGHSGEVITVAWSPDGKRLATGSEDKTAEVWDAATGEELLTLPGDSGHLWGVAWSPDGKRLAAADEVYAMDIDLLLVLARQRVTRNLTTDECRKYLHMDKCPPIP